MNLGNRFVGYLFVTILKTKLKYFFILENINIENKNHIETKLQKLIRLVDYCDRIQ